MVKNSTGGNKSKKFGRKHFSVGGERKELRIKKDPDEEYAVVTKLFGQGMCEVMCNDEKQRLCIIRNKFRGRSKRDNNVVSGAWIMIGIRSWELLKDGSKQKCDLLEVYNDSEKEQLKKMNDILLHKLAPSERFGSAIDDDNLIEFSKNSNMEDIINEETVDSNEINNIIEEGNEISIDDI
jgi:initiation factor 1A